MKQKVVRKGRNQPTKRRFLPLFCLFKGTPLSLSLSSRKGAAESRDFKGCRPRLAIFKGFNLLFQLQAFTRLFGLPLFYKWQKIHPLPISKSFCKQGCAAQKRGFAFAIVDHKNIKPHSHGKIAAVRDFREQKLSLSAKSDGICGNIPRKFPEIRL